MGAEGYSIHDYLKDILDYEEELASEEPNNNSLFQEIHYFADTPIKMDVCARCGGNLEFCPECDAWKHVLDRVGCGNRFCRDAQGPEDVAIPQGKEK